MVKIKRGICPRCNNDITGNRLDGGTFCEYCGQRFNRFGNEVPSFDRRTLGGDELKTKKRPEKKMYALFCPECGHRHEVGIRGLQEMNCDNCHKQFKARTKRGNNAAA